jgi:diguanylate cyclase (GGDEF)-like protein
MQLTYLHNTNNLYSLWIQLVIASLFLLKVNLSFAFSLEDDNFISDIDTMLIQVDKLRSNDPTLGQEILVELESNVSNLSEKQRHYLTYLSASKSIYNGDYQTGEAKLLSLLTSNASNSIKFRANYSLINLYTLQQRWQEGLQQVAKVLTSKQNTSNDEYFKIALITVISFYNEVEQYHLALEYSEQLLNNISENRTICIVNQLVLLAKLETNQLTIKSTEISHGIELCKEANEPVFTGLIRNYQAKINLQNSNADASINALLPHLKPIESTNYNVLITLTYNLLAQAYHLKDDIENTKKYALLAQDKGQDLPRSKQIVTTYQLLFKITEQEGDYKKALGFHKKFSSANQRYLDEVQAKQLAIQLANHNDFANKKRIEQQDQQINLLNIQHLLTKKKAENSLLLIMLLVSFLIALAMWAYKSWLIQQRLKQLTEFDNLTNVHSRGHFIQLAKSSLKNCRKAEIPLTCVLFDLDNFKKINDHYGHGKGDSVLKEVTNVCGKIGRQNDILGRLGGEEFAYILPGCSLIIAEDIANKCRLAIESIDYKSLGLNEPITASFGVSDCDISGFELTSVLADADSAMYASKEHGKNCVNIFR